MNTHDRQLHCTVDAEVRSAWHGQVHDAARTPSLQRQLLQREGELLPRFARHYQALTALPRPARRALQRQWKRSLAAAALLLALGATPALAATINVNSACSLVNAIHSANRNAAVGGCTAGNGADTIVLPANSNQTLTSVNNGTYGPSGLPIVTSPITITGNGATIRRSATPGTPQFRIFVVGAGGNLTLQRTRVSGGALSSPYRGGGLYRRGGNLTLTGCTISGNTAYAGGGVASSESGTVAVTDSVISGNTGGALGGGGVFNLGAVFTPSPGTLIVTRSSITGNSAPIGGGIQNQGIATLTDATVSYNTATAGPSSPIFLTGGGGVLNTVRSSLTLTRSTVSGNRTATSGGGVRSSQGSVTLTNSTVSRNTAGVGGGGLSNDFGVMTVLNVTVFGNTAVSRGGGILSGRRVDNSRSDVVLIGSLISGNVAPSGAEVYQVNGGVVSANSYNLFGHSGLTTAQALSGFILTGASDTTSTSNGSHPSTLLSLLDLALVSTGGLAPTHALAANSPAVDRMVARCPIANLTNTDQLGVPRPQDGNGDGASFCDIGAVERVRPGTVTCNGLPATIVGTSVGETINGTAGRDVIQAGSGNDVIQGQGGDDVICGGPGNDRLLGGAGNDRLFGNSGTDQLTGDGGFDRCDAGSANTGETGNCEQVLSYQVM